MIKSMTGFGKATLETPKKKITFEIKSLNSRQLDISTRLPYPYREKEPEIRNLISRMLDRGKIDLSIYFDMLDEEGASVINKAAVINYYKQIREVAGELNISFEDQFLNAVLKLPEVLKNDKAELSEEEWDLVKEKITESILMLDNYRTEEGVAMEADLRNSTGRILILLGEAEEFESGRIIKVREKLNGILNENNASENIDKNRFEQELIYYLEKYDFNEEKVRLKKHCDYFIETMATVPPNGKILNFITQEIGREINTIGSKANDASIQKLVVMMKDEMEKIKELTLNIL